MATRGGEGKSNIKGVILGETETDCTSVVQYDGMSFLDYKKKHQTLPDTHKSMMIAWKSSIIKQNRDTNNRYVHIISSLS